MSDTLVFSSDEAAGSAFESVVEVAGILQPLKRQKSTYTPQEGDRTPNDQVVIMLEDAEITEMKPGVPAPELTDGQFKSWMSYAPPGHEKPSDRGFFIRGFAMSAEGVVAKRLGIVDQIDEWRKLKKDNRDEHMKAHPEIKTAIVDMFHTPVVLRKKEILLMKRKNQKTGDLEDITREDFTFTEASGGGTPEDLEAYVFGLLVGKTPSQVYRTLAMDARVSKQQKYMDAARDGALPAMIGLVEDNDGFLVSAEPTVVTAPKELAGEPVEDTTTDVG